LLWHCISMVFEDEGKCSSKTLEPIF
jgi:hypothetical protein